MGPCLCGDTGCRSCGPAMGAPCCEYSSARCGDPECECASSSRHHPEEPEDVDAYVDELAEAEALEAEYRELKALGKFDDPRLED